MERLRETGSLWKSVSICDSVRAKRRGIANPAYRAGAVFEEPQEEIKKNGFCVLGTPNLVASHNNCVKFVVIDASSQLICGTENVCKRSDVLVDEVAVGDVGSQPIGVSNQRLLGN